MQINNLDIQEYHSTPEISSSKLIDFMAKPELFKLKHIHKTLDTYSKAMEFGTLAHMYLLERDKYLQTCHILSSEKSDRRTKAFKDEQKEYEGFQLVTENDHAQIVAMSKALHKHPLAAACFNNGQAEQSFFVEHEATGLRLKARPDYLVNLPGLGLTIVDYKTTSREMDLVTQSREAAKYKRNIQAAFHSLVVERALGTSVTTCLYVVQATYAPYTVRLITMPVDVMQQAHWMIENKLKELASCMVTDLWPGYDEIASFKNFFSGDNNE